MRCSSWWACAIELLADARARGRPAARTRSSRSPSGPGGSRGRRPLPGSDDDDRALGERHRDAVPLREPDGPPAASRSASVRRFSAGASGRVTVEPTSDEYSSSASDSSTTVSRSAGVARRIVSVRGNRRAASSAARRARTAAPGRGRGTPVRRLGVPARPVSPRTPSRADRSGVSRCLRPRAQQRVHPAPPCCPSSGVQLPHLGRRPQPGRRVAARTPGAAAPRRPACRPAAPP